MSTAPPAAAPLLTRGIQIFNRQRRVRFDLRWLRQFAAAALAECEKEGLASGQPLAGLSEVEVTVVSDRAIASVHAQFMDIPGATDVITFEHGEIIMSAETAQRYAREFGQPLEHELGLYVIHGLLHLNGHDDREPAARVAMEAVQAALFGRTLRRIEAPARA